MMRDLAGTAIQPLSVSERDAAVMLGVSQRTFVSLVTRGDIQPIKIPGVRRVLFDVADLRALVAKWKRQCDPEAA